MIGVLDSGTGGENTLASLRVKAPLADVVFLRDEKNAPYGTKKREELVEIVAENIRILTRHGADSVLIACCTASCIWKYLPREQRDVSYPIIDAIARRAGELTKSGKIAVIATDATVRERAFSSRLHGVSVIERSAQILVDRIDRGLSDASVTHSDRQIINGILSPFEGSGCDTLILGCTHFPSLIGTFIEEGRKIGIKNTVSSSAEGAEVILGVGGALLSGRGITVRI